MTDLMDVKSLEHPTLKVPYELLNKKFRTAQKNIDREISQTQQSTTELEMCINSSGNVGDMKRVLSGVVEKLTALKRKAAESIGDEIEAVQSCKRRLEHLKELNYQQKSKVEISQWRRKRMDRMLVEHFLRGGYYNTAVKLASYSDIEDLTNINIFLVSRDIEESLSRHDTSMCLNWCYENRSKLRKMKSSLEFELRQQEFIEYIKVGRRLDAVKYARKYFSNIDDNQIKNIQKAMGLLAYPLDTKIETYKELLDPLRWNMLVKQFRQENFKLYQLNQHSVFTVCLQAGLSALKTPQCSKDDINVRNPDCPVCSPHLYELGRNLPYAHCSQSRLICSISGESLDEYNPPMMLPNGHVYGCKALTAMAEANEGNIVCPRTKEIYTFDETEKVYVM